LKDSQGGDEIGYVKEEMKKDRRRRVRRRIEIASEKAWGNTAEVATRRNASKGCKHSTRDSIRRIVSPTNSIFPKVDLGLVLRRWASLDLDRFKTRSIKARVFI